MRIFCPRTVRQLPKIVSSCPHSPHTFLRIRAKPQHYRPVSTSASTNLNSDPICKGKVGASSLAGKKCLVTGASRGIGKAIAERFAKQGARCVLVGRSHATLEGVRGELECFDGKSHDIVVGDVGDAKFWEGFRRVRDIDILVNAAGVTHHSPCVLTSENVIEEVLRTNLLGTMLGCRTVGKGMMANRDGCIINVASLLGLKGGRGSAAYVASKAGVIGFTRALAAELGEKQVRVNVILPGYIETDMTAGMAPEARSAALNAIPLKHFGQASDIADAAEFLATNKYANNCVLNLDGGLSAT
ncbi:NAD(P)-binding protein [Venustampulla echinocandica]|uniref:NAD(P)-binding protein n=1 Tax=Venustampulla echinocandica TaxID=2656787 RepID=A0A370TP86_9HELO|nr:NAD(P)-binding protein [Venustampulla echinocandica]RDL37332.1 NAD(P)-binding protein [Venustampulla echinocandica]